jgi:hypothetical protein
LRRASEDLPRNRWFPTRGHDVLTPTRTPGERGRRTSLTIRLTPAERETLLAWQRPTTISAGRARRGRIVLLVADGMRISDIAQTVRISRRFVYQWMQLLLRDGLQGLGDKPGRGHCRVSPQPAVREERAVSASLVCAYKVDTVEGYEFREKLPSPPRCSVIVQTKFPLMVFALLTDT